MNTTTYTKLLTECVENMVGKADKKNFTEKDCNPNELQMGINVEQEHTNDPQLAKKIALDHLAEIPDYYSRLKKMEDSAKQQGAMTESVFKMIEEKAVSKSQQRLFGMARAVQKGEMKAPSKKIADIAKNTSPQEVKKYAETKRKGLPEKKKKSN